MLNEYSLMIFLEVRKVLRVRIGGRNWKTDGSPRGSTRNGGAGWHVRFVKEWIQQPSDEDLSAAGRSYMPR